ncbi:hypothetical protein [Thalassolituus oleivorans]|uniref:hypothetical protein n=1 Tax=Thalassolituus oleivorans TaxID=187493 RepID=UPI0023F486D8|nr:hypothetical protein [Thalassolituus oleivorans]
MPVVAFSQHLKASLVGVLLNMFIFLWTSTAQAEIEYVRLHKGPGAAYPIVFEVSSDHVMDPIAVRGDWLLLSDGRKQGWLPLSELHLVKSVSVAQMWQLRNDARPSDWRLELNWNSESALGFGAVIPLHDQDLFGRYTVSDHGAFGWSVGEVGLTRQIGSILNFQVLGSASVGVGSEYGGSNHWNSDTDEIVPLALVSAEVVWAAERYLDVALRVGTNISLDSDMVNHSSVSLAWKLRL